MVARLEGSLTFLAARMNFCLGVSGKGSRGVEEAGEHGDIGLAAHDPLSRTGGIRLAIRPHAGNVVAGAFRNRHSSRGACAYRRESGTAGALFARARWLPPTGQWTRDCLQTVPEWGRVGPAAAPQAGLPAALAAARRELGVPARGSPAGELRRERIWSSICYKIPRLLKIVSGKAREAETATHV